MPTAFGGHVRDAGRAGFSVFGRTWEVILGMLPMSMQNRRHDIGREHGHQILAGGEDRTV